MKRMEKKLSGGIHFVPTLLSVVVVKKLFIISDSFQCHSKSAPQNVSLNFHETPSVNFIVELSKTSSSSFLGFSCGS
ncbi:hypothetical protein NC651_029367 [Populus alba x Populus x berolinensis]|nr:hypothetical protein NC651_029367 [Populus alba x Populus x berolinensis]